MPSKGAILAMFSSSSLCESNAQNVLRQSWGTEPARSYPRHAIRFRRKRWTRELALAHLVALEVFLVEVDQDLGDFGPHAGLTFGRAGPDVR